MGNIEFLNFLLDISPILPTASRLNNVTVLPFLTSINYAFIEQQKHKPLLIR